jgi:hypothetical protein
MDREGLDCSGAHLSKEGVYSCKKHGSAGTFCLCSNRDIGYGLNSNFTSLFSVPGLEKADQQGPYRCKEGRQEVMA